MSVQQQLLDFLVIRRADWDLPEPSLERLPDGFEHLKDHNLISYKSRHEPFDHLALLELFGHLVAYSKIQAKEGWRDFMSEPALFALSTRKPSTEVMANLLVSTEQTDLYEIPLFGFQVHCVVLNRAPRLARNWLWNILASVETEWKDQSIAAIFREIREQLDHIGMETQPDYRAMTVEWLKELPLEVRLEGIALEERLKGIAPEERLKGVEPADRLKGLTLEERIADLAPEEIERFLALLQSEARDE